MISDFNFFAAPTWLADDHISLTAVACKVGDREWDDNGDNDDIGDSDDYGDNGGHVDNDDFTNQEWKG